MKTTLAVLFTIAGMGSALAQSGQAPPPPQGPTELQCSEGYKAGMQWTQAEFTKACADLSNNKKQ